MMKKILTILSAAALLAGCGGYKPPEENKPAENTPDASAPAETASTEPAATEGTKPKPAVEFNYPETGFALVLLQMYLHRFHATIVLQDNEITNVFAPLYQLSRGMGSDGCANCICTT